MKRKNSMRLVYLMLCLILPAMSFGQLSTERIFNNGMVLQRDVEIPVWGEANALDTVIVTLNAVADTTYADEDGKWELSLEAMPAGGPYEMVITNGEQTFTRSDVYIGDVFLASGQSNMEYTLNQADGGTAEAAAADYEEIRQFKIPKATNSEKQTNIPAGSAWKPATSANAGNFSAVAYYCAKDLYAENGVPIGIVNASYGGARIEAFMSDEMLGFDETWITLAGGEKERQPTLIYNAMINPILRVPLKGILWYQGESNADKLEDALAYGDLFQRMINSYREAWNMPELPFLWIQLPNFYTVANEANPSEGGNWPQLRIAQSRALALPNTGEVVAMDLGDYDIHPPRKEPVGQRLALVVRHVVYGEDIAYSGPRYKSHKVLDDGRLSVKFDHSWNGLVATGEEGDTVHWFSMADAEGTLYPAEAVCDADSVVVWNDEVADPAVLRYAWEFNPDPVNLYNDQDLPAAPFMVDVDYPGFEITSFTTSDTILERGSSAILAWKVYGSSDITLNDQPVDSIGAMEVWPLDTTEYRLSAVNRLDGTESASITRTIDVIDPMPTILLKSVQGELVEPGTEVTLRGTANAPGGGTVAQVEFFIDGASIAVDTEEPYETIWNAAEAGEYVATAVVTNGMDVSIESDPVNISVDYITLQIYEAEDASHTGTAFVRNNASCSGNKYLDLQDGWVLTFSGVHADTAGTYNMHIRYLLNYESPKNQNLYINGTFIEEIAFTAPNSSTWQTYKINVELLAGDNEVEIEGSWQWMSFDYIALALPGQDGIENLQGSAADYQVNIFPNPASHEALVSFRMPEAGNVSFEILDLLGRQVAQLENSFLPEGENQLMINTSSYGEGVYFIRLNHEGHVAMTERMVIVR